MNSFFENLYGEDPRPMGTLPPSSFHQLDPIDIDFLSKPVTNEKIKVTFFYMASLKAPSSNDFHAFFFFQKQ